MAHKPSICTMSLGRCFAGHSLPHKLDMAAKYGFQGIEVFYEDLVDLAKSLPGGDTPSNQITAARTIHDLCAARSLDIICLQPFLHFGGLVNRADQAKQFEELRLWFDLVHALQTDLILFPSSWLPEDKLTDDFDMVAADFITAAEMGLQQTPVVRFAFEGLCWGTRINTWEASWDIVQRVDRTNFGLCIDSYNILGKIYADPTTESGKTSDCEQATLDSIKRLLSDVDVSKVFLLQVADGERLSQPLNEKHPFYNAEQPARMSWSRNSRLFYGETSYGAYLPSKHLLRTLVQGLGFEGWLSFEVFNRRLTETDNAVPEEMAKRAAESWEKMKVDLGLRTSDEVQPRLQAML
ncbi:4-hydroxyphenylpyruvate dioxygenase [Fusarium heterosporum]|uniref:4-hydroxyphenylpyruvate dioxygenase n=1 Tax=Fusarium heterosporum TaxID=42747 RepID=A0A8H5TSH7_FUSHE|nr:4-hydroxyphenylpyruvate dioxygenase [Fusarium heterosporum]